MSIIYVCDGCGAIGGPTLPADWQQGHNAGGYATQVCSDECYRLASAGVTAPAPQVV